jgi:hypothetical protein
MFERNIQKTPKHYLGTPKSCGRSIARLIYYPFSKNKWIIAKKCLKKQKN